MTSSFKNAPKHMSVCVSFRGGEEAAGETGALGEGERKEAGHRGGQGPCCRDATRAVETRSGTRVECLKRPHGQNRISRQPGGKVSPDWVRA